MRSKFIVRNLDKVKVNVFTYGCLAHVGRITAECTTVVPVVYDLEADRRWERSQRLLREREERSKRFWAWYWDELRDIYTGYDLEDPC